MRVQGEAIDEDWGERRKKGKLALKRRARNKSPTSPSPEPSRGSGTERNEAEYDLNIVM